MSREQNEFYKYLEKELFRQNYIDVQGQISYLFVFVYKILAKKGEVGYEGVYDELMNIAEAYHHETIFFRLCKIWAADCLLANNEFEAFLEQTEPDTPIGREKLICNLRLNIQMICGLPANGIDLFKMVSGNVSKPTKKYLGLYRDMLLNAMNEHQAEYGNWFKNAEKEIHNSRVWEYGLFRSSIFIHNHKSLTICSFDESKKLSEQIISFARNIENNLRENAGLPKIGEGWVSETELFYFLKNSFPETHVVQHGKPAWLGKQHFDIWFPRWKIAVEYHGRQHFEPVEFFGGKEAFEKNKQRDEKKIRLAGAHKVKLFIATEELPHDDVAKLIINYRKTIFRNDDYTD